MATEQTAVKMNDGSTVMFSAKDKVKKLSKFSEDGATLDIIFAFRDGSTGTCSVDTGSPVILQAALHGLNQKFGDSFAGLTDVDDCVATFAKLKATIEAGEWTQSRVGDGMAGTSVLAKAMVKVTGKDIEAVKAKLASLSKEEKQALRTQPKVAAAIAEINAAKPAKTGAVDGDAVLGEF